MKAAETAVRHGPYCALCGQCKACSDAGIQPDYGCYDSDDRRHLYPKSSEVPCCDYSDHSRGWCVCPEHERSEMHPFGGPA